MSRRRPSDLVVFLGPSLPAAQARKVARCQVLPPARQGDVWRALALRPRAIALVDGVFRVGAVGVAPRDPGRARRRGGGAGRLEHGRAAGGGAVAAGDGRRRPHHSACTGTARSPTTPRSRSCTRGPEHASSPSRCRW
jgi:hypothetical protein